MPGQAGQLTDAQILAVVCHERFTLGGADPVGANETSSTTGAPRIRRRGRRWKTARPRFDDIDTEVPGAIKVGTEPAARLVRRHLSDVID